MRPTRFKKSFKIFLELKIQSLLSMHHLIKELE